MNKNWKAATLAVQGGYEAKDGEPRVAPIVQSTTYRYDTTQSVADLFDLKRDGFFYSRLANPTVDVMEKKIATATNAMTMVYFLKNSPIFMLSPPFRTEGSLP